jgi:AAA ATPase domain
MDPVRNPYAPGAGQRPPELTGRDREIRQFEVVLERIARGRPERSMVLTGLRGVGKTVLLNTFRSMALQRLWGTGKIEARPDQSIRRPVAAALHTAVRELAPRHRAPDRVLPRRPQGVRPSRPEGTQGVFRHDRAWHRRARPARPRRLR